MSTAVTWYDFAAIRWRGHWIWVPVDLLGQPPRALPAGRHELAV